MRILAFWLPVVLILWLPVTLMATPPPPASLTPPTGPPVRNRTVRCLFPLFPRCFNVQFACPLACLRTCFVDCVTCRPVCRCNFPGAIFQDPQFVGGDGNTFCFHGRKVEDFCLVSDANLHVHGHFIGKRNTNLRRDFTWVQAVGITFDNHRILVAAKKTSTWDDYADRLASIMRTSNTNGVMVEVLNNFKVTANFVPIKAEEPKVHGYEITIDEDCFAYLELGFKFFSVTDSIDGVLGQTYRSNYVSKTKVNVAMPVMGGASTYMTSGLFATDCAVSPFGRNVAKKVNTSALLHQSSILHCSSGMQGNGLICKK